MNPTLEQLARYVVQELERGVPEVTLYASMRESGWTTEWINAAMSAAKQRAVPPMSDQLTMPAVQVPQEQEQVHPRPAQLPAQPVQPLVRPVPKQPKQRSLTGLRKPLWILIALLAAATIGLGGYKIIAGIQKEAQQKVIRDAGRREDLSIFISDLSDYYVAHHSYPTRTQLNTPSFLEENGFMVDSTADPKWSPKAEACSKDGKPVLAEQPTPDCYAYEVTTSKNGICNNGTIGCTKSKISIWLEVDKKAYTVTFDKNTQVD